MSSNAFKVQMLALIVYNSQVTFWSVRTFWDSDTNRTLNTATSWALMVYACQSLTASQVYYSSIILQWLFLLIIGVTYISASCTETCLSFSKSILLPVGNKLIFQVLVLQDYPKESTHVIIVPHHLLTSCASKDRLLHSSKFRTQRYDLRIPFTQAFTGTEVLLL